MKIEIRIVGETPLLMHNPRMVDPEYDVTRKIKALTSKRKKTDEDLKHIAQLEWYGGIYEENGVVVQPTSKLRKCLINTGKISKLGKALERTLIFDALNVPLEYEGPANIDKLYKDDAFHSRLSVGVGTKRVMRVRPSFFPWAMTVTGMFITDAGLDFEALVSVVELAGSVEGIGDNRVNGYGRFKGTIREVK